VEPGRGALVGLPEQAYRRSIDEGWESGSPPSPQRTRKEWGTPYLKVERRAIWLIYDPSAP
jgi:hypothetical protein